MAIVNPPGWLENSGRVNTAQQLRSYIGILLDMPLGTFIPYGGVHRTAGQRFVVSQTTTPSMNVVVGSGAAVVPGTLNNQQGAYFVINDAQVTVPVSAAEPSLPRIDIVQLRVRDDFYSGAVRDAVIDIKKGTPSSSPSAPAPDDNAIVLAEIMVPASATSISNGNITDKRPFFSPFARSGSILETDFQITSEHPDLDNDAFAVKLTTETNNRWKVKTNGEMWWGPGSSSQDTNLYRGGENLLATDDTFRIRGETQSERPSATDNAIVVGVNGDSIKRFLVRTDGLLAWGNGTNSRDTNLYRSAANTLKTDDNLIVDGNLTVNGVGQRQIKIVTSDQSKASSTSFSNVSGLSFSLAANATYVLDGVIFYDGPDGVNVGELALRWTFPSGTRVEYGAISQHWNVPSGTGGDAEYTAYINQTTSPSEIRLLGTSKVSPDFRLTGLLAGTVTVGSTSGTLQLQFAQWASSSTAVVICRGSWIRLERVA